MHACRKLTVQERFQDASETLRSSIDERARAKVIDWGPTSDAATVSPYEIGDLAAATLQCLYRDHVVVDVTDVEEDEAARRARAWDLWGDYLTEDASRA